MLGWTVDFAVETTPRDIVTMIATHALTRDETWPPMKGGEFKVFLWRPVAIVRTMTDNKESFLWSTPLLSILSSAAHN